MQCLQIFTNFFCSLFMSLALHQKCRVKSKLSVCIWRESFVDCSSIESLSAKVNYVDCKTQQSLSFYVKKVTGCNSKASFILSLFLFFLFYAVTRFFLSFTWPAITFKAGYSAWLLFSLCLTAIL